MKRLFSQDKLIDTHCHLNDSAFDADREAVVGRAVAAGVAEIWDIAVNVASARRAIDNAKKYRGIVRAAIGIDPEVVIPGSDLFDSLVADLKDTQFAEWLDQQAQLLQGLYIANKEDIVAIGETGIDNYWLSKQLADQQLSQQAQHLILQRQELLFEMQIKLAEELDLPLSVHSRGAEELCLEVLQRYRAHAIFHSYTGSAETALEILNAGYGLGVNGIITYKNGGDLLTMYQQLQQNYADQLYFETDAPYLAPGKHRGERNEPGFLPETVKTLA